MRMSMLNAGRQAKTELDRWWSDERPTAVALFLFAVRWTAWAVALFIVVLAVVPEANVRREPFLLLGTFAQNAAATLYLPFFRPRVRTLVQRSFGPAVDDILVLSLLDMMLALGVVFLSGGWDSPYYLFAVASLLVPSSILGLRSTVALTTAFVAAYTLVLATAGAGTDGPWHGRELNNFAVFLMMPYLVSIVVQFLSWQSRQLAAERETARRALEENLRLQEERQALAAEQERTRIAREIHDGVGQSVYMLSLGLEAAAESARDDDHVGEQLRRLVVLAKQTLLEVRHYIFDLKPLLEGEAGVTAAMRNQVREFTTVSGLPVALRVTGEEGTLPVALGTALYRIVQEAMANVFRHAGASEVRLSIAFEPETVTIEVRDDGTGIAPGRDPGRGLTQMRQRVEDLRGTVSIESEPGRGTVLRATLPRENRG